jgi:hypothetical protein
VLLLLGAALDVEEEDGVAEEVDVLVLLGAALLEVTELLRAVVLLDEGSAEDEAIGEAVVVGLAVVGMGSGVVDVRGVVAA